MKNKMPYKERSLERDLILFKWKSDSMKLPLRPEYWITEYGSLGYDLKHDKWVVGVPNAILDEYGCPTQYVAHTLNTTDVDSYTLKWGKEVIVCGNTPLYRPFRAEREYYSYMKEQTDISVFTQLLNTRLNKAITVPDDQMRKQLVKAYKEMVEGLPLILVTQIMEEISEVNLTDPQEIDKMQYLTSFYQSLEKREANAFGVDLENLDKRAQVSTTEIQQYDDVTTLNYLVMWEMRMDFMKEMKEAGYDLEIVRNPIFFDEPEKEDIEEGNFEAAASEPEEEMEQEDVNNDDQND